MEANKNTKLDPQKGINTTGKNVPGKDYTLTPGQNPEPNTKDPTQPNREWNENEKVDDSQKMYAHGGNVDEDVRRGVDEDVRGGDEDIEDEDTNAKDVE